MHKNGFILGLCCVLLALGLIRSASAQVVPGTVGDVVQVTLLPGWRSAPDLHMAAIRISLAPGWKTYWRAPGDAGFPTAITWRGSRNLDGAQILWPRPSVFRTLGIRSVGYQGDVILPLAIRPDKSGAIFAKAVLNFGVCEQICIPVRMKLSARLPASGDEDPRILAAMADRPLSAAQAGIGKTVCKITPTANGMRLRVEIQVPPLPGKGEAAVIETGDNSVWVSEPSLRRKGGTVLAEADLVPQSAGFAFSRSDIRITLITTRTAVDIQGCTGG